MMGDLRDAIGAAVAPYLVEGQEQDVGIADAVVNTLASLPLPRILDALGHTYREAWKCDRTNNAPICDYQHCTCLNPDPRPVIVVDNPATDEAHDA